MIRLHDFWKTFLGLVLALGIFGCAASQNKASCSDTATCKNGVSRVSTLKVESKHPQVINAYKVNFKLLMEQYKVDPAYVFLRPLGAEKILYDFPPELPQIFQAIGEAAELPNSKPTPEPGPSITFSPFETDPTCTGPPGNCNFYPCPGGYQCLLKTNPQCNVQAAKCPHT